MVSEDIKNLINECRDKFTSIPNVIYEMGLDCHALALFGAIKRSAGDSGKCTRSARTLAFNAGMSSSTISVSKQTLVMHGLIDIAEVKSPRGRPAHEITMNPLLWIANNAFFLIERDDRPEAPLILSWSAQLALRDPSALLRNKLDNTQRSESELIRSESELIRSEGEMRKNHEEEPIKEKPTTQKGKRGSKSKKGQEPPKIADEHLTHVEYMDVEASRTSDRLYFVVSAYQYQGRFTCSWCSNEIQWPRQEKKRRSPATRTCEECGAKHLIHGYSSGSGNPKTYGAGAELQGLWDVEIPYMPVLLSRAEADSLTLEQFLINWHEDSATLISVAEWMVTTEWFLDLKRGQHLQRLNSGYMKRKEKERKPKVKAVRNAYKVPKELAVEDDDEDDGWKELV